MFDTLFKSTDLDSPHRQNKRHLRANLQQNGQRLSFACALCLLLPVTAPSFAAKDDVIMHVYEDIDMSTWSGQGDLRGDAAICIATSAATFQIRATGPRDNSGDTSAFRISGARGEKIPVRLFYKTQQQTVEIMPASITQNLTSDAQIEDCEIHRRISGTFEALIEEDDLSTAPAGTYSGSIHLIVRPE